MGSRFKFIWPLTMMLVALPLTAQEPATAPEEGEEVDEGPYVAAVHVNVVNVDVFVTDKRGNPITGLTIDDFELYEDGKPIAITNFYAVEEGQRLDRKESADEPAEADGSQSDPLALPDRSREVEVPADERLHLMVYIDNFNIRPFNRNRVFRQLRSFLNGQLNRGDRVMLVSYDRSIHVRHPFTADPHLVSNALFELETVTGHAVHLDSDRRDLLRDIEEAESIRDVDWRVRQYAESLTNDLQFSIDALKEIIDSMAGLPGRKALLYVSDGLPMVPAEDMYYALNQKFQDSTSLTLSREFDSSRRFQELAYVASTNQVVLYTIDAAGLRAPESSSVQSATAGTAGMATFVDTVNVSNIQAPLRLLADQTGGRAIYNSNDVGPGLEKVARDFRSFYSLGYSPSHNGTGRLYRIKIKVPGRKGVQIRHRENYRDKPHLDRMSDVARATLAYGFDQNPLEVLLRFGQATPHDQKTYVLPILVGIPLERIVLVPQDDLYEGRVKLYFGAIDEGGDMSEISEVDLPIHIPIDEIEDPTGKYFPYQTQLQIRDGGHRITVGLWDEVGGVSSFVSKPIQVGSG